MRGIIFFVVALFLIVLVQKAVLEEVEENVHRVESMKPLYMLKVLMQIQF
jgi:hypothetical protein